jgi:hypothetical protein
MTATATRRSPTGAGPIFQPMPVGHWPVDVKCSVSPEAG